MAAGSPGSGRAPPKSRLGALLRRHRKTVLRITQQKAADSIGITRPYLSAIENDKQIPTWPVVSRIATEYGLNRDELWLIAQEGGGTMPRGRRAGAGRQPKPTITFTEIAPPQGLTAGTYERQTVPIRGTKHILEVDAMELSASAVDSAPRAPGIAKATGVFGFQIHGRSMAPIFREGDLLFADTGRAVKPGDHILLNVLIPEYAEPVWIVRRLVSSDANRVVVEHFTHRKTRGGRESHTAVRTEYPRDAVLDMVHVLDLRELLGAS